MRESYWGYWIILLGIFVIVIMMLISNVTTTNTQDYYLIKETTEAAMVDAIDLSYYRLSGELKINKEKFVESFIRRFAENVALNTYTIDFYALYESPPKVSVKVTTKSASYTIASSSESFDIVNKIDAILELDGATLTSGPENNNISAPTEGSDSGQSNGSGSGSNSSSGSGSNSGGSNSGSNNGSGNGGSSGSDSWDDDDDDYEDNDNENNDDFVPTGNRLEYFVKTERDSFYYVNTEYDSENDIYIVTYTLKSYDEFETEALNYFYYDKNDNLNKFETAQVKDLCEQYYSKFQKTIIEHEE